ncbi:hypothetical protein MKX03_035623, partial [Papaver bracteatum]
MESSSSFSPFKDNILKGKVALLTGGGSGIGFEITCQFGKHGASVAIMGRRKNVLDSAVSSLRSLGIQAIGLVGDVRKREDAIRVLDSTIKHFGRLDILVNAAAGNFLVSAEDLSPNGFRTVSNRNDSLGIPWRKLSTTIRNSLINWKLKADVHYQKSRQGIEFYGPINFIDGSKVSLL